MHENKEIYMTNLGRKFDKVMKKFLKMGCLDKMELAEKSKKRKITPRPVMQ